MHDLVLQLAEPDAQELSKFLISSKRPEGTLSFQELQGFLFAVASCPEMVPPSDWLPMVSNEEEFGFEDHSEAQHIVGLIMTLFNQVNAAVMQRSERLPADCDFLDDIKENLEEHAPVSQWSRGFFLGHDWLSDVWDDLAPESLRAERDSCVMVLSFFANVQLAEFYHLEATTTPRRRKPAKPFEEFAESMRELFPKAMVSYAHLGRTISDVLERVSDPRS